MAKQTNEDRLYNSFDKVVESVNNLSNEVNAELNHGVGFETKENRDEFIKYFDEKFNDAVQKYAALKVLLQHLPE